MRSSHSKISNYALRFAAYFLPFVMLFCMLYPFSAGAMNLDYLDESKWVHNENVTFEEIHATALNETLTGVFGYYTDSDMCIYTYFSVTGSTLEEDGSNARIVYEFHTPDETYSFGVDSNGICDAGAEEERVFDVRPAFDNRKNGRFIAAVAFLGKEDFCSVDISFYANRKFLIKENIPMERPQPTKAEKTTRPTTEKKTTQKAGKTEKETTVRAQATTAAGKVTEKTTAQTTQKPSKSTTHSATKYRPKGSYEGSEAVSPEEATEEENEAEHIETAEETYTVGAAKLGTNAWIMLAFALLFAIAGIVFLLRAALAKDKKENTDGGENKD